MSEVCKECSGRGSYWTEWSDRADADPVERAQVLYRPEEPDGTVEIFCQVCSPQTVMIPVHPSAYRQLAAIKAMEDEGA